MNKQIIIFISVAIVIAGCSFFGGMEFQKSQKVTNSFGNGQNMGNFQRQGGQPANGTGAVRRNIMGGFSSGTILSKDDKSITIKLKNGGSQIIILGNSTSILKSTSGTKEDLSIDQNVTITGKTNTDGSLTAESIQIRPEGETVPPMMNGLKDSIPAIK